MLQHYMLLLSISKAHLEQSKQLDYPKTKKTQKVALLLCLRRVCDPKKSRLTFLEGKHCRRDELKWKMSGSLYFLSMINGTQKCFLFRKFKCQRVNIPILIQLIRINFFALDTELIQNEKKILVLVLQWYYHWFWFLTNVIRYHIFFYFAPIW